MEKWHSKQSHAPISNTTAQHSLKVYHNVQAWKGIVLAPQEWGRMADWGRMAQWKIGATSNDKPPAPAEMLEIIRYPWMTKFKSSWTCASWFFVKLHIAFWASLKKNHFLHKEFSKDSNHKLLNRFFVGHLPAAALENSI